MTEQRSADPVLIRIARATDAEAVSTLLAASYSRLLASNYDGSTLRLALPYMTTANLRLLVSGTYYVVEDESGSALLGCGGWTFGAPDTGQIIEGQAHIRHFATRPDWGRRGIGTSLLVRCVGDARIAGARKLHCLSTLNAEPFYSAAGFESVGPINVPMGPTLKFPGVLMKYEIA